jgi:hypothetical protein
MPQQQIRPDARIHEQVRDQHIRYVDRNLVQVGASLECLLSMRGISRGQRQEFMSENSPAGSIGGFKLNAIRIAGE